MLVASVADSARHCSSAAACPCAAAVAYGVKWDLDSTPERGD